VLDASGDALAAKTVRRSELFFGFLSLGLLGFGGIAPWARHVIVERRRWLSERDYAEFVSLGQVLPGSNTINASVLIGQRFHGLSGAVIAVVALMTMPLVVLVMLAVLYERFAALPEVSAGLAGAAAAAAGMVIGTALKMAWKLRPTPVASVVGVAAFAAAGIFGFALLPTIVVLVPLSVGATSLMRRR
jgi:chromate transporter